MSGYPSLDERNYLAYTSDSAYSSTPALTLPPPHRPFPHLTPHHPHLTSPSPYPIHSLPPSPHPLHTHSSLPSPLSLLQPPAPAICPTHLVLLLPQLLPAEGLRLPPCCLQCCAQHQVSTKRCCTPMVSGPAPALPAPPHPVSCPVPCPAPWPPSLTSTIPAPAPAPCPALPPSLPGPLLA